MLSDAEQKRIREEELFRREVQKKLDNDSVSFPGRRLWGFVNSSFGLWLLSSVVLGALAFLYGYVQDIRHAKREAAERVARLKFEIKSHGWDFFHSIEFARDYVAYSAAFSEYLQRPKNKLADFKDATMDQLLWEYGHFSGNPSNAVSVERAIDWIWQDIYSIRTSGQLDSDTKHWLDRDIDESLKELFFPRLTDRDP